MNAGVVEKQLNSVWLKTVLERNQTRRVLYIQESEALNDSKLSVSSILQ